MRRIASAFLLFLWATLAAAGAEWQGLDVPNVPSMGSGASGIRFQSFTIPAHARVVLIGDSITAARGFAGYGDWILFEADGKFYPKVVGSNGTGPTGWNQGVVGNTSAQVIARLSNVSAENPRAVGFGVGTNDIGTGAATAAQICANYDTIIASIVAAGAKPFAWTVIPRTSAGWSGAQEADRQSVRSCLLAKLPAAQVVDSDTVITDTVNQLMADGTHPNGTGAQLLGNALWAKMQPFFSSDSILPTSPPSSPANLYANPFFTGGATVATSWTFFQNTNGLTKAASKTTVDGYEAQRYVASGTATANVADNFNQTVTPPGGLAGDLYEAWVEVLVTKATGITGIAISAGTNNTNATHMSITSQDSGTLTVPFRGVMRAPPSVLASDGGNFNSRISFLPANGATVDADITLLRANYRKVPTGQ